MANETAVVKKSELAGLLDTKKETILHMLNRRLDLDYFVSTALLHVAEQDYTYQIARGNPQAFIKAVVKAAEFGLSFSRGLAFLVPFGKAVAFVAGYQGLVQVMLRGQTRIHDIKAKVVYQNEVFKQIEGTSPQLIHEPLETAAERGPIRGAYAIAFFRDGNVPHYEYLPLEDLDKRRDAAKARNKGKESDAWKLWEDEMYLRAPIRKLFKFIPQTEEGQKMMAYEDELWGYDQNGGQQEDKRPTGQRVHDRIKQKKADMHDEAEAQYEDLPPSETVDESTGEVIEVPAEEPEPEKQPAKRGRQAKQDGREMGAAGTVGKQAEAAGAFDPSLANETIAELINGGKITMAQYRKAVRDNLDYPTDNVPPTTLHQDEAVTVLEALGYASKE